MTRLQQLRRASGGVAALLLIALGQAGCRTADAAHSGVPQVEQLLSANAAPQPHVVQASHVTVGSEQVDAYRQKYEAQAPKNKKEQQNDGGDESKSPATTMNSAIPLPAASYSIDLPTALALAGATNPTIGLAREFVAAADAERLQADALLFPTVRVGADVNVHRGNLLTARGRILDVDRQSAFVGSGAAAVGAGTVTVPGIRVFGHLADALYEPLATRQRLAAASLDAVATNNSVLRDVAVQYFALVGAEARLQAFVQSEIDFQEIARLTANFAKAGQGRAADAERAGSEAELLRVEIRRAEEDVAVAAAELARLLSLDPACFLRSDGHALNVINLACAEESLESLVATAVANRPEIAARTAGIAESETRFREEKIRPYLPLVSVGYSVGGFGGGSNLATTNFGSLGTRGDFDAIAVWTLSNGGLGNRAIQRRSRAEVSQAEADRLQAVDLVRREVAEAHAQLTSSRQELEVARRQLRIAEDGYRADLRRSENIEGLPIEVLNSANLLSAARQAVIRAIIIYDQAQFQLLFALGQRPDLPVRISSE